MADPVNGDATAVFAKTDSEARSFTMGDQEAFAALSGDRNPMHMDPVAARRTQAGAPAVHGVHGALWALERLAAAGAPLDRASRLKVEFQRFLHLDAPVVLAAAPAAGDRLRATLSQGGSVCTVLDMELAATPLPARAPDPGSAPPAPPRPAEPDFAAMPGITGRIGAPDGAADHAAALFPQLVGATGAETVVAVALLSTLVGMVVPGLHSIFSGFSLDLASPGAGPGLGYRAGSADPRFRVVGIDVEAAAFRGTVRAFARFPPVPPARLADLAARVAPGEFAGRHALVIGGSRGIGAATALLLAAGGARVTLSYRRGRAEAEAIRDAIVARHGAERARILAYDTDAAPAGQLADAGGPFSHVAYFATGRIFGPAGGVFDPARLAAFTAAYVTGFHALVAHLLDVQPGAPLQVLYPSSVAVETRPRGMTEYAMAKAAGEILCADLARAHRRLTITWPRLPRILTDQTATVPPVPAADPIEVMLPLLRAEAG